MAEKKAYPKTIRDDNICNICQRVVGSLSEDHIPPKGAFKPGHMNAWCYPDGHKGEVHIRHKVNNGLVFKTICRECNSLLGGKYDVYLNDFLNRIQSILNTPIVLPNPLMIKCRPTAVIKAIMGHILASKTGFCNSEIDIVTREYLMNDEAVLPPDIHLYYWFYPYDGAIIATDRTVLSGLVNTQTAHYEVLKYFPLAFNLMYGGSTMTDPAFLDLTRWNSNDLTNEVEVPIYFHRIDPFFPEADKYNPVSFVIEGRTDILVNRSK